MLSPDRFEVDSVTCSAKEGNMGTFTTLLSVQACRLPASYVRHLNTLHDDEPYAPTEHVDDVEVEVEYNEGWYEAGNRSGHPDNWTEDSGEDAEVTEINLTEEDWKPAEGENRDLLGAIQHSSVVRLIQACNEHQEEAARNYY